MFDEIHDSLRARFNKYTSRALEMLPEFVEPSILDIGCGTGVPTIELARLIDGQITAVDIDKSKLERLEEKVKNAGLTERVKVMHCSMFSFKFPDHSFDIIWAEGSIAMIGFARGIMNWSRLIKPNGFLVVHDMTDDIAQKLEQVDRCGYTLINHFTIPGHIWWSEYYEPLEKNIEQLRGECHNDRKVMAQFENELLEVDKVKKNPKSYSSTFLIMQKTM
ncbi:MAG: class I SAM-dependent methyltransferase [bacterium]